MEKHLDILSFYTCVPLIKIIWCMVPEIWSLTTDGIFWSSSAIFCPFTPLTPWKMKISKMKKKTPGDIIILHKCTKNHDNLLYCSRDMAHDRCNSYFHFGLSGIFPSTFVQPVNSRKNSILNWVIKLNLIKLPMKFYSSQKNCCRCRQTMCRLCLCNQRVIVGTPLSTEGRLSLQPNFQKGGAWQACHEKLIYRGDRLKREGLDSLLI